MATLDWAVVRRELGDCMPWSPSWSRLTSYLLVSAGLLLWHGTASAELATGPYSSMRMCLERTVLNVNVMSVRVRFDVPAQRQIGALASGRQYSDSLAARIAQAAVHADEAQAVLGFQREVELEAFLVSLSRGVREATKIGWISPATAAKLRGNLSDWFGPLRGRDFQEGERLVFLGVGSRLTMTLVDRRGKRVTHRSAEFQNATTGMLAFFYVPGSGLREPLIRSLFSREPPDC